MPIDCSNWQICGVYRIFFIWEFAGGKSKFAHAFLEALKNFFFGGPLKKAANLRDPNFFFIITNTIEAFYGRFQNFDKYHSFCFIEGADKCPRKVLANNAPTYAS